MPSDFKRSTLSTTLYRLSSPFLFLVLFFVLLGAATCTLSFAQGKTQPEVKLHVSVGVSIDTSMHQKKVIEFQREVVNSIADAFSGLATESFVIRYGDEVETLQDWSPLNPGLKRASTRIELEAESGKNQRTFSMNLLTGDC